MVDLVDIKPDVSAHGSGITLQGNAFRVLRQLGVWDRVQEHGYGSTPSGSGARPGGSLIVELDMWNRRTRTSSHARYVSAYACPDPGRPGRRGRRQGQIRCDLRLAHSGRQGVDVAFTDGPRPLRPGRRRGRHQVRHPGEFGIDLETESTGWASGECSPPDRSRSRGPTCSTAARATSRATARPVRTSCSLV